MKEIDIPTGWKKVKLKDVLKELNERNKGEKVKRVLSVTNSNGFVNQKDYFDRNVHSEDISKYKIIKKDEFAYNPSRINVGSINILKEFENGILSPMYIIFEIDKKEVIPEYFKYYFQTNTFLENVKMNTQGSVRDSLSFNALLNFDYSYPDIEEQQKIVGVLDNTDKIINNIYKEYEYYKMLKEKLDLVLKRGLNQKLVKTSIGKVGCNWDIIKAGDMFENISIKNKENEKVLSVTQDRGVILREECVMDIKYSNEGLKNYKYVEKGNYIISLRSFQGGIEYCDKNGIVSPAYTVLKNKREINYDYYRHYFKSKSFIRDLDLVVEGIRDGKQISYSKFKDIYIVKPEIEDQNIIADLLNIIEKKNKTLNKKIEQYKMLKKGLLQKLLTGKVKVNV